MHKLRLTALIATDAWCDSVSTRHYGMGGGGIREECLWHPIAVLIYPPWVLLQRCVFQRCSHVTALYKLYSWDLWTEGTSFTPVMCELNVLTEPFCTSFTLDMCELSVLTELLCTSPQILYLISVYVCVWCVFMCVFVCVYAGMYVRVCVCREQTRTSRSLRWSTSTSASARHWLTASSSLPLSVSLSASVCIQNIFSQCEFRCFNHLPWVGRGGGPLFHLMLNFCFSPLPPFSGLSYRKGLVKEKTNHVDDALLLPPLNPPACLGKGWVFTEAQHLRFLQCVYVCVCVCVECVFVCVCSDTCMHTYVCVYINLCQHMLSFSVSFSVSLSVSVCVCISLSLHPH